MYQNKKQKQEYRPDNYWKYNLYTQIIFRGLCIYSEKYSIVLWNT